MTRQEHLEWSKQQALKYVDLGQLENALAAIGSDLNKHEGTKNHPGVDIGLELFIAGHLNTPEKMRDFIRGFR